MNNSSYLVLHNIEIIIEDMPFLEDIFSNIKGAVKYTHMRKGDILKDIEVDKEYCYYDTFNIIANADGLDFDGDMKYYVKYMASFNNSSFLNNIQPLKYPEMEIPFIILPKYLGKIGLDQDLIRWRLEKGV